MVTFSGRGDPQTWLRTFDAWFEREQWSSGGWRRIGAAWYCRFDHDGHEVQIVVDPRDPMKAVMTISGEPPLRREKR
jgi:hypothetical protein